MPCRPLIAWCSIISPASKTCAMCVAQIADSRRRLARSVSGRPTSDGTKVEERRCRWREAADHQVAVEEDRRDLRASKRFLQVAVGAVEILDLADSARR